ncbi:lipopolysaccharide biosynthesis protein [Actinoplanes sp. N902-109]|uniref:lipopolysaccharide biosynthesis protein n=1 Tax=Actinoplanes sp. (strain N902-109) TaxID=649831 RepID=UPI0003295103|nr:oligosaccharide flippase family protein [Actinoplanes sp. N902-109]AGL16326.1 Polysaccharide biosynthesis protein [Actinoplanes sp. N902-109]
MSEVGTAPPRLSGLARASGLTAVAGAAGRGAGLLAGLAGAAALGPAGYGAFAFLATSAVLVSACGVLGFGPLLTRAMAADPETRTARLAAAVLIVSTGLTLGAGLVLVAGAWLTGVAVLHGTAAPAVLVWALGTSGATILTAVFTGHRLFGAAALLTVARAVLAGTAALGAAVGTGNPSLAALAAGGAEVLLALAGLGWLRRTGRVAPVPVRLLRVVVAGLARPALAAGVASLAIQGALWLTQNLLLSGPGGLADNGAFALAGRLSLVVSMLPLALGGAAVPYLSRVAEPARGHALARQITAWGLVLAVPVAALLAGLAPAVNRWFGPGYAGYAPTTTLMAVTGVAVAANSVLGSVAVGLGTIRDWIVSDLLLAVVLAGAALMLVPRYGSQGAALAHLAGYGASAACLAVRLRLKEAAACGS